jgi:hypothetical protein
MLHELAGDTERVEKLWVAGVEVRVQTDRQTDGSCGDAGGAEGVAWGGDRQIDSGGAEGVAWGCLSPVDGPRRR